MNHSVSHPDSWRKSSYSQVGNNNCVEVNDGAPSVVAVRDSQNPDQATLTFASREWAALVNEAKRHSL